MLYQSKKLFGKRIEGCMSVKSALWEGIYEYKAVQGEIERVI